MSEVKTKVLNPEDIEFKFEITFKLRDWIKISEALDKSYLYPMSDLADSIKDCTRQAKQVFVPDPKSDEAAR